MQATFMGERGSGLGIRHVDLDPVSRVAGALSFHAEIDHNGRVNDAHALSTLFRGYEVILKDRDARDAVFISSRACGVCGGAHATAAAMACEMAFGVAPPPMAIAARNLMSAIENLYDHPLQLFLRAGPDYSEPVVREATPELWRRAEGTSAPGQAIHGFKLISDIMTALTRETGELYLEALLMSRFAREAYVLIGGKYPHPETMVPGGVSSTIDTSDLNLILLRIVKFPDYAQRVVAIWNDIVDFFLEADPGYGEAGTVPMNFIDLGQWDDPLAYDAKYENCAAWGERRFATPGVIVNGSLTTTRLPEIDSPVEEFVDHSFYEEWPGDNHPAHKQTIPRPSEAKLSGKYSWSTAPRWHGHPMETGAYARLWTTAMANKLPHRRFVQPTGHSLLLAMPRAALPPNVLEWRMPQRWGTFERTRARAYALAHSTLVAYEHTLIALDLKRRGETKVSGESHMSNRFKVPKGPRTGVGFWGSGRGYLSHHMSIEHGVIQNYQILGPSTWTMSPRDRLGTLGVCEQAVTATPLLSGGPQTAYLDILRTIRSFDPCMACAAH
ncbi:MAG TPA: nickel-dependent hydrogenase large subunit [Solirubrobacteraceae bacterium]|jgi:hydrogenase large subunit|nr:nickel-dependent hydrogenase large subunit [Solirubrobacteraceae bacterium]